MHYTNASEDDVCKEVDEDEDCLIAHSFEDSLIQSVVADEKPQHPASHSFTGGGYLCKQAAESIDCREHERDNVTFTSFNNAKFFHLFC